MCPAMQSLRVVCEQTREDGKVVHSALPARLLVDDIHAYIFMDYEVGNSVSAPGVGGNVPLVAVDMGQQPKSVMCIPHL